MIEAFIFGVMNRSRIRDVICWGGADSRGSKEPCIRWCRSLWQGPLLGGHGWEDGDVTFFLITLVTCY